MLPHLFPSNLTPFPPPWNVLRNGSTPSPFRGLCFVPPSFTKQAPLLCSGPPPTFPPSQGRFFRPFRLRFPNFYGCFFLFSYLSFSFRVLGEAHSFCFVPFCFPDRCKCSAHGETLSRKPATSLTRVVSFSFFFLHFQENLSLNLFPSDKRFLPLPPPFSVPTPRNFSCRGFNRLTPISLCPM